MSSGAAQAIQSASEMNCTFASMRLFKPQVLKLGAEARQPLGLRRLRTKFVQIEKLAERLVAGEPSRFRHRCRPRRRRGQLQIHARIYAERRIVDHLR